MHFPVGWDPYFKDYMTLTEVYHYPTQHYDHHRKPLTLAESARVARSATPWRWPSARARLEVVLAQRTVKVAVPVAVEASPA